MIGHLAKAVAADLSSRKFPHPVIYGPELCAREDFKSAIVFERDREAGDAIVPPVAANGRNPARPFHRNVSGRVTVYARSPKPGADVLDHEDECDGVCDGVITALYSVLKERGLPLQITESRILRREDLRADGDNDDRSGARFADATGCAARIRFSVGTAIRYVTYPGAAKPTGTVFDADAPLVTSPGLPDYDPAPGAP